MLVYGVIEYFIRELYPQLASRDLSEKIKIYQIVIVVGHTVSKYTRYMFCTYIIILQEIRGSENAFKIKSVVMSQKYEMVR